MARTWSKYTDAEMTTIRQLAAQGKTYAQIAKQIGRSKAQVGAKIWKMRQDGVFKVKAAPKAPTRQATTSDALPAGVRTAVSTIKTVINSDLPDNIKLDFIRTYTKDSTTYGEARDQRQGENIPR